MVRQLAVELGPRLRVNAVCGGPIDTESFAHLPDAERMLAELPAHTPLRRVGNPDDIAGAVALLLSPDARWITGQTIVADGGLSCV